MGCLNSICDFGETKLNDPLRQSLHPSLEAGRGKLPTHQNKEAWKVKNVYCFNEKNGVFIYTGEQSDTRFRRTPETKRSLLELMKQSQDRNDLGSVEEENSA